MDQNSTASSPGMSSGDQQAGRDRTEDLAVEEAQIEPSRLEHVLVEIPNSFQRETYKVFADENRVAKVLREEEEQGEPVYTIQFGDTRQDRVPRNKLLELENGQSALQTFQSREISSESDEDKSTSNEDDIEPQARVSRRRRRARDDDNDNDEITHFILSDLEDEESDSNSSILRSRKRGLKNGGKRKRASEDEISYHSEPKRARRDPPERRRMRRFVHLASDKLSHRSSVYGGSSRRVRPIILSDDEIETSNFESNESGMYSDLPRSRRKRGTRTAAMAQNWLKQEPTRRSERLTRTLNSMREIDDEQIYSFESEDVGSTRTHQKPLAIREIFQPLPRGSKFRERHISFCDTCRSSNPSSSQMVYCQGCTLAYHQTCLGPRSTREHLVTKVGEDDFVLQCRRCVNAQQKKDPNAPDLARCQDCRKKGLSCVPFRARKTLLQEQKEREENEGNDPICEVPSTLLNNPENLLFRCIGCSRASHFHHLEPRNQYSMSFDDETERADARFDEYSKDWKCKECADMPGKVDTIIAWRPVGGESHQQTLDVRTVGEDEKEYLIKWQDHSYFQAQWMPGAWTWGVVSHITRSTFFKKCPQPKMTTEDAIPEEWLRIDIVLDVKYTNRIGFHTQDIDRARIKEVDTALIKYKGLGYEDAVWEKVPRPEDGDRWTDFVTAYNDWVLGRYTSLPSGERLRERINNLKSKPFEEKKEQPANLEGGKLMKYQLEGLNWLFYKWYQGRNGILADEMGLGKTIQVISFLAMMVHDLKCYPFLVVVPNSTCPNWRREIKQWAPSLRVVTYYGSAIARDMAFKYELFPGGSKQLRCHAVVISYETAIDEGSRKMLRSVPWQGMIVDEGQRLKNDGSLLHNALSALKIPFRVLLTGTPLQNNARELFNLLQFLDDSINAEQMEKEYEDMTNEKITQLHDLIRPYILRRTKLQVLHFLPAMAQIILPVSMSTLQKKTYKSILAKKPELLRSLFSQGIVKASDRIGLSNILMQLRKCLCHPFVFNSNIEERGLEQHVMHKNLVEASSKLQLLELLLPKLQQRGHRVLIFSQFLDMLDIVQDFLDGMGMLYQRLDGTISALEKQRRIDEFNAPDSALFAFLLSTRAGGVGINLATADTVIILDPDFNPHQDIQAISRAHRIGQTKKVLCFQMMTRASVEEKILQVGRRKMALDEVVINQLDDDSVEDKDMESILKHGMAELFDDEKENQDIRYDDASIDLLLDRSQIENTKSGKDSTAESQFSFARVWENDSAALQDSLNVSEEETAPNQDFWDKILKERERKAAERAAKPELGRGKRARNTVNYDQSGIVVLENKNEDEGQASSTSNPLEDLPKVSSERRRRRRKRGRTKGEQSEDSDTDFRPRDSGESADESAGEGTAKTGDLAVPDPTQSRKGLSEISELEETKDRPAKPFQRVTVLPPFQGPIQMINQPPPLLPNGQPYPMSRHCPACKQLHVIGSCPLKLAGVEYCNLCGLAHFGYGRVCPHLKSETMVRTMLTELKLSSEPKYLVDAAANYLRNLKKNLAQNNRMAKAKAERDSMNSTVARQAGVNGKAASEQGTMGQLQLEAESRPLVPSADPQCTSAQT
ncbi:uncharacterized protein PV09_07537 [Verruconis gallopava]|uniref:Chromatin remodeling factor mit1 n=1 Tax=Verruconis gallopava TaxID=253628 RepID=A0A0D2A3P0_9PEZI|nr:uncharacterized protein PV09_07537 [Verruconis gallopava]KIW01020.1 hypothetical protein PV09_07537 [Verruconis gallopava]